MEKTLCLIGCGDQAKKVYADSLKKLCRARGGIVLAACCDTDLGKAEAFRKEAGFARAYADYRAMLQNEQPDAVILVTPFTVTAAIAVEVIEAGCDIMLEKPPGKNLEECLAIADAVKRRSPVNLVAFNRRNAPIVKRILELLYGAEPLRVQHIDYQMYRYNRTESHFHTTAIHGIDMIAAIARSGYERLAIDHTPLARYGEGASNLFLQGRFRNGVTTQQSYCPMSGLIMERMTISADDAALYVETPIWHGPDYPGVIRLYRRGRLESVIRGNELDGGQELFETDGFYNQLCEFIDCILQKRQTPNDIFSAIDSIRIADCLARREAQYDGR